MSGFPKGKKRRDVNPVYRPLYGLTVEEAEAYLREHEVIGQGTGGGHRLKSIRVVAEDGEGFPLTCDWIVERLNVEVSDGRISDVRDVG